MLLKVKEFKQNCSEKVQRWVIFSPREPQKIAEISEQLGH
jgi:hypothetical protein